MRPMVKLVGRGGIALAFLPGPVIGGTNDIDVRVLIGKFECLVLHIIRVEDDHLGTLVHELHCELGGSLTGIGRGTGVDIFQVKHFGAWKILFHVQTGIVMCLAPALVVMCTDHQDAENERLGGRLGDGNRRLRGDNRGLRNNRRRLGCYWGLGCTGRDDQHENHREKGDFGCHVTHSRVSSLRLS